MFENFKSRHNLPLSDKQNGYQDLSTKIMFNSDDMLMHVKNSKSGQIKVTTSITAVIGMPTKRHSSAAKWQCGWALLAHSVVYVTA